MDEKFYFDTSIWLDFLEKRNEPNLPKGEWAKKLVERIINSNNKILFSDVNMLELGGVGYSEFEIEELIEGFQGLLIYIESSESEIGKARDLSQKRDVPKQDALHALIARDNKSILVTLDSHFKKLEDISKPHSPKEFIGSS